MTVQRIGLNSRIVYQVILIKYYLIVDNVHSMVQYCTMIFRDEKKNNKLISERNISFDEIAEIILHDEYLDILENPNRNDQMIFIVKLKKYVYAVPFLIDEDENIILKTAYPSRKFNKKYGDQL